MMTQENTPLPHATISSPPSATTPTLQALLVVNADLTEARAGLALALYAEQQAAVALEAARAQCEILIVTEAGGEKGLGPNEAAQKRALTARLEDCYAYAHARSAHQEAVLDRRLAETDVTLAEGQFQALLAALQRGIIAIPAEAV